MAILPTQSDCIFCKIVAGALPSCNVYEDDNITAFLDLAPVKPGHSLVITKGHYQNILEMPAELGSQVMAAVSKVGRALMSATDAEGFNVLQNNFHAAGQIVMHVHWHIIPRHKNDGLELWKQGSYKDNAEMAALANKILRAASK